MSMNRRDLIKTALPAAALVPTTGCATLTKILTEAAKELLKQPEIAIKAMRVTQMAFTNIDALFDVEITNPNAVGIKLGGIAWDLELEKRKFVSGKSTKGVDLAAQNTATTQFAVSFPLLEAAQTFIELLQKRTVDYNIATVFSLGSEQQSFDIPVAFGGTVPMPKPPLPGVKSFGFTNISTAGVGAKVNLTVNNPNPFKIPIDAFTGSIKINGREVLKNARIDGVDVKSNATSTVPVEFTMGLADMGLSIAQLALQPNLTWAVDFALETAGVKFPIKRTGSVKLIPTL